MPCNSDYLEPMKWERDLKVVAGHLLYVREQLHKPVSASLREAAKNCYGRPYTHAHLNGLVRDLCRLLRCLPKNRFDALVYDARNAKSRRLADWWEKHERADVQRKEEDEAKKRKAQLREQALKKLTPEELQAFL